MTEDRGLTEALQRRADQLGTTHPLTFEDVQGKARGIRRRRTALSGLAAAAVLAVAAPIGLSLSGSDDPGRTPDVAATEPASTGVKDGVLTIDVDADGGEPGIPYLYDGAVHLPDGGTVPVAGEWTGFDTLGDGFVVSDGSTLNVLTSDGEVMVEAPTTSSSFAVSPDHSLVTYLLEDTVQWIGADGSTGVGIPVPGEIESPRLVAVQGSDSCDPAHEGGGCVVFLDDGGPTPGGWSLTSKGIINPLGEFSSLSDVSPDGWVSGTTTIDELEPSSCNEVWRDAFADGPAWETCDHRFLGFSPDSAMVIGSFSYASGFGDSSLAILDTEDGTVLTEWKSSEEHQAAVVSTGWDTDGSVLAMVNEGVDWALMRFSPDGGLSKVMEVEGGYADPSQLLLPESS
jgi:hypothetical protein